jgi:hypothetical protein
MSPSPVTSGGVQAPTRNYDSSIISMFPRANKKYLIESSIQYKFDRDYLSTNCSLFSGQITDNFIEFNIPAADGEFLDFSSISLEMKLRIRKADGGEPDPESRITLVDGFFHRLFQGHSIFLNGVQTEGSNNFGLLNVIKFYTSMSRASLESIGCNMLYKSIKNPIVGVYTDADFTSPDSEEESIMESCKRTIHAMGPLYFDMSTSDSYLLDNVNVRIRLELANPSVVIISPDAERYKYEITLCKLWCRKIVPLPSALLALNNSLNNQHNTIEYMFNRPIVKTIIFPENHSSLSIDSPFNGIVPHKIIVFTIDQASVNGQYNSNPNFFKHNSITSISLDVNGNNLASIKAEFPYSTSQAYFSTLNGLGIGNHEHLITKSNFKTGRTLFVFDTRPSDANDTINLERSANIRITIQCSKPCASNQVVYIVGYTLGVMQISGDRRVFTHYLN